MLTLSDIRSRVRTRFEASSTTRWSNSDVNDAINDGIEELAEAIVFIVSDENSFMTGAKLVFDGGL